MRWSDGLSSILKRSGRLRNLKETTEERKRREEKKWEKASRLEKIKSLKEKIKNANAKVKERPVSTNEKKVSDNWKNWREQQSPMYD